MAGLGVWFRELFGQNADTDAAPASHRARTGGATLAEDNNEFAVAMYGQLRQQPGNLFVSPFSIRIALAMTLAGARGDTAAQMRETLCISSSDEMLHVAITEIVQRLNTVGGGKYQLAVANSLWGQNGSPLQPDFLDLIARHYADSVNLLDFRRDAERARLTINLWVEDKTRERIRDLIPSGGVNADTRVVLANAIYFKGTWELPFDKKNTDDEPFYLESGKEVQAPLMHLHKEVRYLKSKGYQAVDLAYAGGDVSLLVLLPDRRQGLRDLEKTLSGQMLDECVTHTHTRPVEIVLPRFKLSWGGDVRAQLAAQGMPLAFEPLQADFSGMNGYVPPHEESLSISHVFHKTVLDVNEVGTEAAAATAVVMAYLGSRPVEPEPIFRADHPFLFAIRERKTGAILFLGRLSDPTREN